MRAAEADSLGIQVLVTDWGAGCRWQGAKGQVESRLAGPEQHFVLGVAGSRRKVDTSGWVSFFKVPGLVPLW